MQTDESFWAQARQSLLTRPDKINLNAGTLSPTPKPILDAAQALRAQQAVAPSDFCWRQLPVRLQRSRQALAGYLNCAADELLLLPNVTYAANLVINSLHFEPGSEILTTDHEYGAMAIAWQRSVARGQLKLVHLPLPYLSEDPQEIIAAFDRAITPRAALLFFSHVMASTGMALPVKALCALARRRRILSVVDGAHAPGMIDVDLRDIDADFYGANCHKWMMAPNGCGFLHVKREHRLKIQPLVTSWGYVYDREKPDADSAWGGSNWQRDLEFHGTADRCPQMVLPEVIAFRGALGGESSIQARMRTLERHAREAFADAGFRCATPANPALCGGGLTAFELPCKDVVAYRDWLWNTHDIECPVTEGGGRTFLRVSTAWFTTCGEIDRLVAAVRGSAPPRSF